MQAFRRRTMGPSTDQQVDMRVFDWLGRHWKLVTIITWLAFSASFILPHLDAIRWFDLGDTDDNMRMMQVRALLHGQGWFDLRQYRLDPPVRSDIHLKPLVTFPSAQL